MALERHSTNLNIRKVHNDKFDSKKLALIALNPDLKTSVIPSDLVLNIRNLVREYYRLKDQISAYVNKLTAILKVSFPEYLGVFSKITVNTSLALPDKYPSPSMFLSARKSSVIKLIRKTSHFGEAYAEKQYGKLLYAAKSAMIFGHSLPSDAELIRLHISLIRTYDNAADGIVNQLEKQKVQRLKCSVTSLSSLKYDYIPASSALSRNIFPRFLFSLFKLIDYIIKSIKTVVESHPDELFIKQIRLLETIKGCGFLSAVTLMCEIGDFSVFSSPKKLYAYLGLDPAVKQSGKFNGTNVKLSKRGSRLARRVLHMMALNSIGFSRSGEPKNPVLRSYYDNKCISKPKMVALSAVAHKLCNIIFAILRDSKPFEIISPEQHNSSYHLNQVSAA